MRKPKKLRLRHKEFLASQGCKSREFLFLDEDAESYTFLYRKQSKIVVFRR